MRCSSPARSARRPSGRRRRRRTSWSGSCGCGRPTGSPLRCCAEIVRSAAATSPRRSGASAAISRARSATRSAAAACSTTTSADEVMDAPPPRRGRQPARRGRHRRPRSARPRARARPARRGDPRHDDGQAHRPHRRRARRRRRSRSSACGCRTTARRTRSEPSRRTTRSTSGSRSRAPSPPTLRLRRSRLAVPSRVRAIAVRPSDAGDLRNHARGHGHGVNEKGADPRIVGPFSNPESGRQPEYRPDSPPKHSPAYPSRRVIGGVTHEERHLAITILLATRQQLHSRHFGGHWGTIARPPVRGCMPGFSRAPDTGGRPRSGYIAPPSQPENDARPGARAQGVPQRSRAARPSASGRARRALAGRGRALAAAAAEHRGDRGDLLRRHAARDEPDAGERRLRVALPLTAGCSRASSAAATPAWCAARAAP